MRPNISVNTDRCKRRFAPPSTGRLLQPLEPMRTLQQILEEMNGAGLFFGVKVDSVHSERFSGETALHIFAKWGDAEAISILVENGADINKRGEDQNTPLHYAAMLGKQQAVERLVTLGAKNLQDRYGNTPKQLAVDHLAVHEFLDKNGF